MTYRIAGLNNLKPNDWLTLYHGTRLAEVFPLINGFDAAKVRSRSFGGPRHKGLFLTPSFRTARNFASYGPTILEIVVRAKNLHGTDYSGVTGRDDPAREEIWRDRFPNSFRPYLSQTLSQSHEPQALLQGLVSPRQIQRIWYAPSNKEPGQWYTRKEFLELGLEAIPAPKQPYGKKEKLQDLGIDLSYPNYSHDELIEALSVLLRAPKTRIRATLERYLKISLTPGKRDVLTEIIERSGFEPRAAQRYADRLRGGYRLRERAIRLAFENPRLRPYLVPLLQKKKFSGSAGD